MQEKIGGMITWFDSLDSTNDEMSRWVNRNDPPFPGHVIVTRDQYKGKGMADNSWLSEPLKNLTFSFFIRPGFLDAARQFYLNIFISLAVYDYVRSVLTDIPVTIKWPNDIYAGTRKIAGVLISHAVSGDRIQHTIAGIGLNVNQTVFPAHIPNPVSLKQVAGHSFEVDEVLESLLERLNHYYDLLAGGNFETCRSAYRQALFGYNKWLKFIFEEEVMLGRITGVSETGMLMLEKDDKSVIKCDLKEIEFLI